MHKKTKKRKAVDEAVFWVIGLILGAFIFGLVGV